VFKKEEFPNFTNYIGSKKKIIDFVIDRINEIYSGG